LGLRPSRPAFFFSRSRYLAEIPTRLVLPSECDRQLLAGAATKLVTEHRDAILEFMNRSDTIGLRGPKGR
jgi:hypothetical protein